MYGGSLRGNLEDVAGFKGEFPSHRLGQDYPPCLVDRRQDGRGVGVSGLTFCARNPTLRIMDFGSRRLGLLVAALLLIPTVALADAILFPMSAYRLNTVFYANFALVVLLESVVLKLGFRQVGWPAMLWKTAVINAASSVAAYPYHYLIDELTYPYPLVSRSVVPIFLTTLAVEVPLIWWLFRRDGVSWTRAIFLGLAPNALSYAVVLSIEKPEQYAWLKYQRDKDQKTIATWKSPELLAAAPGRLYATFWDTNVLVQLACFDWAADRWQVLTNCPRLDRFYWDINGSLLAYLEPGTGERLGETLKLAKVPSFEPLREIPMPHGGGGYYGGGWGPAVKISPDRTKVAVLVPQYELYAVSSNATYDWFGFASSVVVLDLTTGVTLGTSPRKATYGLCWLPDSRTVLFNSLRDERLLERKEIGADWTRKFAPAKVGAQYWDAPVYAFEIGAGTVRFFSDMVFPNLVAERQRVVGWKGSDSVAIVDLNPSRTSSVVLGGAGMRTVAVSPDGRWILTSFPLRWVYANQGYPAIVDLENPSRRHAVSLAWRYVWTRDEADPVRN